VRTVFDKTTVAQRFAMRRKAVTRDQLNQLMQTLGPNTVWDKVAAGWEDQFQVISSSEAIPVLQEVATYARQLIEGIKADVTAWAEYQTMYQDLTDQGQWPSYKKMEIAPEVAHQGQGVIAAPEIVKNLSYYDFRIAELEQIGSNPALISGQNTGQVAKLLKTIAFFIKSQPGYEDWLQ